MAPRVKHTDQRSGDMTRDLTESELKLVDANLFDLFFHECDNIAAELGVEPVDGAYSDVDMAAIIAEFESQHRQSYLDLALQNAAADDDEPATPRDNVIPFPSRRSASTR
jgi:hypothetical protein